MSSRFILMWLEAPLQSWGFDSKFSRRESLNFPTKSGVLGLICCALGASGEQKELLQLFAPLKTTVLSFRRKRKGQMAHEPMLRDFHMVGSGYNSDNPFELQMIPKKSNGKAANGGVKLTYRYYLQDSTFAVVLEVPTELLDKVSEALNNPVWDLYLGRKSCAPTDFIFRGVYLSEDAAIEKAQQIAQNKSLHENFRVLDGEHEGDVMVLNDVPIMFGEKKEYCQRHVTIVSS